MSENKCPFCTLPMEWVEVDNRPRRHEVNGLDCKGHQLAALKTLVRELVADLGAYAIFIPILKRDDVVKILKEGE